MATLTCKNGEVVATLAHVTETDASSHDLQPPKTPNRLSFPPTSSQGLLQPHLLLLRPGPPAPGPRSRNRPQPKGRVLLIPRPEPQQRPANPCANRVDCVDERPGDELREGESRQQDDVVVHVGDRGPELHCCTQAEVGGEELGVGGVSRLARSRGAGWYRLGEHAHDVPKKHLVKPVVRLRPLLHLDPASCNPIPVPVPVRVGADKVVPCVPGDADDGIARGADMVGAVDGDAHAAAEDAEEFVVVLVPVEARAEAGVGRDGDYGVVLS